MSTSKSKVTTDTSAVHEDTKQQLVKEMTAAFSVMSSNQMSVLYQKSPDILSQEKLFDAAYTELELNIPFFMDLLNAVVGTTGHKRATIVMIYSMI